LPGCHQIVIDPVYEQCMRLEKGTPRGKMLF